MKWKWMPTIMMVLGALSMAAPTVGQDEKAPPPPKNARFGDPSGTARMYEGNLYGVIKAINWNEIVLTKTAAGTDQSIKLLKKTKFVQDGKSSSLDKFKIGDQIYIDIDKNKKTGELSAKKVTGGVGVAQIPGS